MIRQKYFLLIASLLIVISLSFLSCSKSNPTDDGSGNNGLSILTVSPAHSAPGVLLSLSGFTIDTSKMTNYTIFVGDQQSILISDSLGTVLTIVPMYFDDTLDIWPTPPASALSIEIFLDSTLVAIGNSIFTVDSLPHAPGATLMLVDNSIATVESYKSILASLVTEPGPFEQLVEGITVGMDSLIYGGYDSTLTDLLTALQSSDPDAVELIDALFSSSGAVENSQQLADALQAISNNLNPPLLKSSSVAANDVVLATMMQLSTIVKDFGDSYISGVAQSSSNASSILGGIGLIASANPVVLAVKAFVGALAVSTSIANLLFNKIIVAILPTKLDSMTVTLASDTISSNDTTTSTLMVYASNNPPQITFGDLVDQFLAFAGTLVPGAETARQRILDSYNYLIGQMKNALQAYASANPDFSFDPAFFDLTGVPVIHWAAEVQDTRLLDLHSTVPDKLSVNDTILEWYAMGRSGSSSITITPATGAEAVLLPMPPFFEYHGTAFGILDNSSVFSSTEKTVTIKSALALVVDFAPTIFKTGSNVLGIKAGTISLTGDTTWVSGLNVTLTPIGGTADPISGTTDSSGQFSSIIKLSSGFDSVIVDIRVTSSLGDFAATEVKAIVVQQSTSMIAYLSDSDGTSAIWKMDPDGNNKTRLAGFNGGFNRTNGHNLHWSPNNSYISMDIAAFSHEIHAIRANGTLTNSIRLIRGSIFRLSSYNTSNQSWFPDTTFNKLLFSGRHQTINNTTGPYTAFIPGGYTKLFDSSWPSGMLRYSPDGTKFAFISGSTDSLFITTINLDGTGMVHITGPFTGGVRSIEWTADGTAFVYIREIGSSSRSSKIMKTTMNGTTTTLATEATTSFNLTLLPTKNMLAYIVDSDNTGTGYNIKLVSLDGGSVTTIPNLLYNIHTLSASPDGNEIAFDDQPNVTNSNVYKVNINTFVVTQLTFDGISDSPGWSNSIAAP